MSTAKIDVLRNFDALPDSAILHTDVVAAVTGLSDRTVRHHPQLPRHYISADRYGFRAADVRRLLADGVSADRIRKRVGPQAMRLVAEVSSAPSRAEGEQIIASFDDSNMSAGERGRLNELLADTLAELPEGTS